MEYIDLIGPDETYRRILLELDKRPLGRIDMAQVIDPMFNSSPTRRENTLKKVDGYTKILERNGMVRRVSYHRREDYSLQITDKGRIQASKLKKAFSIGELHESS